jgi:two-component system NarL family sensor kinase
VPRVPAGAATRPVSWTRPSTGDRILAGALTWLLVITWSSAVLAVVFALGGMTATRQSVPGWVAVIAAVAVAVTGLPVLHWLRPAVDGVLFSHPDSASDLIAQVGHRFQDSAADPTSLAGVVAEIADQVSRRLRLPYVAILTAEQDELPSPDGAAPPAERLVRVPLTYSGQDVGILIVLPRPRERSLSGQDLALLQELAVHVGIALHAARVTNDVQTSRAALITAREEERRRIRRDLHDGLGPALASLRLQLAAVQQLIASQPERALELVDRLRQDVRDTSAQVRGLVYDLRPPMLDEFGLLGAIRARAADATGVAVTVRAPEPLPDLPAAVEVALYRIACEALSNVLRHAAATSCSITLALTADDVTLRVGDDGRGLPGPMISGVGVAGMRERAEELGGTLTVLAGTSPAGARRGTSVVAVLPARAGRPVTR